MSHLIVFGNEKGGAGKSTLCLHAACHALYASERVGLFDLDLRQRSLSRFFENRRLWAQAHQGTLPHPDLYELGDHAANVPDLCTAFEARLAEARAACDLILIDTPGADHPLSRLAHSHADQIVTPMNDSFVDFDLLGQIDPASFEVRRPSLYAETVWEARKCRAVRDGGQIDWIVVRNRLAPVQARNRARIDERLLALSKRIGFRMAAGLRDRVIYRELFPFGLTVLDLSREVRPVPVTLTHVSARQELRAVMAELARAEVQAARLVPPLCTNRA